MTESRRLLQHFLAAIAYRTQKALPGAPEDFADFALSPSITDEQFLHGALTDAMTHVGQLAMLRRFAGSPVASEDFIFADVRAANVSAAQATPRAPDHRWRPNDPPLPPGLVAEQ